MRRLRTKEEAASGQCEDEVALIQESLQAHVHKASWFAVFNRANFRRTSIVIMAYMFQQITGQAFVSTYQTVFYKNNGFAGTFLTGFVLALLI